MDTWYKRTSRLEKLPPYLFGRLNDIKLQMRQKGIDIIDFGMGNPNIPTPDHIVNKLTEAVQDPKTHRYSASRGIPNIRKAICRKYRELFNVDLDWEKEAMALLGSKEGLSHLMLSLLDPGDSVLVTNPTFPVHIYSAVIAWWERGIDPAYGAYRICAGDGGHHPRDLAETQTHGALFPA